MTGREKERETDKRRGAAAEGVGEKYKLAERERGKWKGMVYGRGGRDKEGEVGRKMERGGD